MAVIEGLAIKGLTTLTTSIVKKFVDLGWNKVVEEFEASFNDRQLRRFCASCDEYVNIRTLYSSDKDVFINDVYVPLFMRPSNGDNEKYEISNLNYYSEGITNIIGKAGQGKSTFLRKMLLNEITLGNCLPVFFELKYLETDKTLLEQLSKWFTRHNLKISEKGVARLLKYGYVKIFLDGFDEIHPSKHDEALITIKDLSRSFPKTTIVVTSRPDTIITTEPFISNYTVLDLEMEHINQLYLNISGNNIEKTKEAMEQIEKYPSIQQIAKTPILAILLFMTYRTWSKIPDNLSDFYKKIFTTLLTHHDSLKAGKRIDRGIDIPLNDHQIEDVFCAFCFSSFSENANNFSVREASEYMKIALESECQEKINPQSVVEIIKRCTGILCSDGYDQLTFSHKTLQEFYTAVFIADQSEDDKKEFYNSVKYAEEEMRYEGVLKFLSSVDRNDYIENYYIPCFKEMFDVDIVNITIDDLTIMSGINKIIESVSIPFYNLEKKENGNKLTLSLGVSFELDDKKSSFFYFKLTRPIINCLIQSKIYFLYLKKLKSSKNKTESDNDIIIPLSEVLNSSDKELVDDFFSLMKKSFQKLISIEHELLIDFHTKKNRPSLLRKVFLKKKEVETEL